MEAEKKARMPVYSKLSGPKKAKYCREQGAVLVVTLLLTLVLLVVTSAVGNIVFCEKMMSSYCLASEKALMMADSGVETVRARLARDIAGLLSDGRYTLEFEQGTVSVTVTAPNGNGLIEAASQAVLTNGIKKKVTAEFGIAPWVGLTAQRVQVSAEGTCIVRGNAAVQKVEGNYQQEGNRYSGFAVSRVDIDAFKRLAQAFPGDWRVYSGNTTLKAQDFELCRNILVEGNVSLDQGIAGCPEGSLLISSGTVNISPGEAQGRQELALSVISAGDLVVSASQSGVLVPRGYLHSNTRIIFDVAARDEPLTVYGMVIAGEVLINSGSSFTLDEERSVITSNELLKETVLGSMVSYQEVPV